MADLPGSYVMRNGLWTAGKRTVSTLVDNAPAAMPNADIFQGSRRFALNMNNDFLTNQAIGDFTVSSVNNSGTIIGAAAPAYASVFQAYPSGFGAGANGRSRPEQVLSVEDSCLTYNFNVNAAGEYCCATVHYLIGNQYYIDPTVGGRFMFRFRVVNGPGGKGWGAVSQLISSAADWSAMHGEMDLNEGSIDLGMEVNWHQYQATNGFTRWDNRPWGESVWHNTTYDWIPVGDPLEPAGRETVWIDGIKVGESLGDRIAQKPRTFFAFQTGSGSSGVSPPAAGALDTNGNPFPANGVTRSKLQVDWFAYFIPMAA
jgi:hypothetical protein